MTWRRFVFLPDRAHSRWQPSGNRAASENGSGDITPLARCVSDIAERRNAIPRYHGQGPRPRAREEVVEKYPGVKKGCYEFY